MKKQNVLFRNKFAILLLSIGIIVLFVFVAQKFTSVLSNLSKNIWYQAFIEDQINYSKSKKIINQQLAKTPEVTVIKTDKFDNIYRWFLAINDTRLQIRVLPKKNTDELSFLIIKINDSQASAECIDTEDNMYLNGISGGENYYFYKKTGIQFHSIEDIENNLDSILNEIRQWKTLQSNESGIEGSTVLYNCELKTPPASS